MHDTQVTPHKLRVNLPFGTDYTDITARGFDAAHLADKVRDCLSNHFSIDGWGILDGDGNLYYEGPFGSPFVGLHPSASGAEDYVSRTVTFTGKGIPSAVGVCGGPTRVVLFVGDTFNFVPRQKFIGNGADSALDSLALFLASEPDLWADYYGQKAGVRPQYPVQFNAATQRRVGQ